MSALKNAVIHLVDCMHAAVLNHHPLSHCERISLSEWWTCSGTDAWCRRFAPYREEDLMERLACAANDLIDSQYEEGESSV